MEAVKVLLDTEIVLDFFTGRMNDGLAAEVVQIGRSGRFEMCISFLTAVNTIYVLNKLKAGVEPADMKRFFTVLPQDTGQWDDAQDLGMGDFEDALQAACALRGNCFIAVSRDRHFDKAPMSVLEPKDFLRIVSE